MKKGWICGLLVLAVALSLLSGVPMITSATETEETTPDASAPDETTPEESTPAESEPTDPTAPEAPTDPTEPEAPTDPTDPEEPTDPTEPEEPEEPEEPVDMSVSDEMIAVLKVMEGFRGDAYWDHSQWTVGYGTKCPAGKETYYTKENPITEEEALILLEAELDYFEAKVNAFRKKHDLVWTQNQFDALVSFSYNVGEGWMSGTSGYFNTAVREGDMGNKLIYGIVLYSKAGGNFLLMDRRKCEAYMYISGVYKAYNNPKNVPENYRHVYLDGNGGTLKYVIHGYNAEDPADITSLFTKLPTGIDADGKAFTYEFAGWYTASTGGTKVEKLDGSFANGSVIYAQWKDPQGNIVSIPKGTVVDNIAVTVKKNVNVRQGPGTYYPKLTVANAGTKLTITETYVENGALWGKCELGWLDLSYTDYEDVIGGETPDDPQQPEKPTGQWGTVSTQKSGSVNVRTGPSTEYAVKYSIKTGNRVEIFATRSDGSRLWGQLEDGNWICMDYVKLDTSVESITIHTKPGKLQFVQRQDGLSISGGKITVTYSDGTTTTVGLTFNMVSGFDNATLGKQTLTVTYEGKTTTYEVEIIKATVTFLNYDNSVLSTGQYAYGEKITPPAAPTKPEDEGYTYRFIGWDKTVMPCSGDAVYTARFEAVEKPKYPLGDFDQNGKVNDDDVLTLLWHTLFPDMYPIEGKADLNHDGKVNDDDVLTLLWHTLFPDLYPLN